MRHSGLFTGDAHSLAALIVLGGLFASGFLSCSGRIGGEEAKRRVAEGALLVDVRTPQEFAAGHIPGSLNVPVTELEERLAELGDRRRPIVLYCHSGNRSGRAARMLRKEGFTSVYDLGPMTAWK